MGSSAIVEMGKRLIEKKIISFFIILSQELVDLYYVLRKKY
tara:strand:- start:280 stop:402 length:123 start_codon:yes stop_codon:yes gene_type:complete